MFKLLALLTCLGSCLIAGVFFAFSSFVMRALAQLPAAQGISAMQRINVVVLNPVFLGAFVGTALLAALCAVASFFHSGTLGSALLLAAGLCYLVGCFAVTAAFNVPRNERLAKLEAATAEAADYWPVYVREWLFWNHVRALASLLAGALAAGALIG